MKVLSFFLRVMGIAAVSITVRLHDLYNLALPAIQCK